MCSVHPVDVPKRQPARGEVLLVRAPGKGNKNLRLLCVLEPVVQGGMVVDYKRVPFDGPFSEEKALVELNKLRGP